MYYIIRIKKGYLSYIITTQTNQLKLKTDVIFHLANDGVVVVRVIHLK